MRQVAEKGRASALAVFLRTSKKLATEPRSLHDIQYGPAFSNNLQPRLVDIITVVEALLHDLQRPVELLPKHRVGLLDLSRLS